MHDALNVFSDAQSFIINIGTKLSDKSIDMWGGLTAMPTSVLGNTPMLDMGKGNDLDIVIKTATAWVGATATVMVELIMADDAALTTNVVSLQQAPGASITVGIPIATCGVPGYEFRISCPPQGITKRFLGLRYNVFTANITAGTVNAFLALDRNSAPGTVS